MPTNHQTDNCISTERGALVFWAPPPSPRRQSCRVQIIDVFALQVASGYTRDPQGRLLIEAKPSVVAGRAGAEPTRLGAVLGWWWAAALPGAPG
jgi:hypothetical protein